MTKSGNGRPVRAAKAVAYTRYANVRAMKGRGMNIDKMKKFTKTGYYSSEKGKHAVYVVVSGGHSYVFNLNHSKHYQSWAKTPYNDGFQKTEKWPGVVRVWDFWEESPHRKMLVKLKLEEADGVCAAFSRRLEHLHKKFISDEAFVNEISKYSVAKLIKVYSTVI
nr:hypothetical protein [Cressdnaviricota sp.]